MFIPGFVISIVTFPGVIVHELAHQLFCRWCKIPVFEVKYFQLKNPCGYVIHEVTANPMKNFLTAMGPFFFNTLLGALIVMPASVEILYFDGAESMSGGIVTLLNVLLLWLGVSILMHAFPSTGDAKALYESVLKNSDVPVIAKILVAPFIGLIYIGAFGSVIWLDLFYAIAVSMLVPKLFLLFL
ncbi:MAG TPA: metalloprotease family protein [Lachnospiraceae bacterium]|nr:metalloprotease family protein [Lachnospiraceae bacterium]